MEKKIDFSREAFNVARYTFSDYEKWDDGNRRELIDGVPYLMSPAPTVLHQSIAMELGRQISNYLRGKSCKVFSAPFDVRLSASTTDDTVVQPDLAMICDDKKIINGKNCVGAPDMVVEILSPATRVRDQTIKMKKYLEAGVREYWVVDPDAQILFTYLLKNREYYSKVYSSNDSVSVNILKDCVIDLGEVFPQIDSVPSSTEVEAPLSEEAD